MFRERPCISKQRWGGGHLLSTLGLHTHMDMCSHTAHQHNITHTCLLKRWMVVLFYSLHIHICTLAHTHVHPPPRHTNWIGYTVEWSHGLQRNFKNLSSSAQLAILVEVWKTWVQKKGRQQRPGSGSFGESKDSILEAVLVISCFCLERLSEAEFRSIGSTNWVEEMSIIQVNI